MYSPEKRMMYCPFCDSTESHERTDERSDDLTICPNCGGEVKVEEHTSATKCPSCDCYLIFDERVEGEYAPGRIIPFQMGKEVCKKVLRDKFSKMRFAPTDFLSEAKLNEIEGVYVPFWFFDYDTHWDFQGEGTKVRSWNSGDTAYTETSYYDVARDIDIRFQGIPADASVKMPDDVMDLLAPYGYEQMTEFRPEYMSGFYAEKYNMPAGELELRAKDTMREDTEQILRNSYSEYSSMRTIRREMQLRGSSSSYGLLPVWRYQYRYEGREYPFYVNGQTGKIVGEVPVSKKKVWAYTGTLWGCLTGILVLIQLIGMSL